MIQNRLEIADEDDGQSIVNAVRDGESRMNSAVNNQVKREKLKQRIAPFTGRVFQFLSNGVQFSVELKCVTRLTSSTSESTEHLFLIP